MSSSEKIRPDTSSKNGAVQEAFIYNWTTQPIFVSSTFRDMQSERERLRRSVMLALEEKVRKKHLHVELTDLRLGVNALIGGDDDTREIEILKVCLHEIARSRPFLIVLLGDRYGWMPPFERLEEAARQAGYKERPNGRSATALEIEYGALGKSALCRSRCRFYVREPLRYEEMPEDMRWQYSDEYATDADAGYRWQAINDLKARICSDPELSNRVHKYRGKWNNKTNRVEELEEWEAMVLSHLLEDLAGDGDGHAESRILTRHEAEREALAEFVELQSRGYVEPSGVLKEVLDFARSPVSDRSCWGACLIEEDGCGKSALAASVMRALDKDSSILLLPGAAGSTPGGSDLNGMLARWIEDMAAFLGRSAPVGRFASEEEIDQAFETLLEDVAKQVRVVVVLDALDRLEKTDRARHLAWRPISWPANARLLLTSAPSPEAAAFAQIPGVTQIRLPGLKPSEACALGQMLYEQYHCPWSEEAFSTLTELKSTDGEPLTENPLWLRTALGFLAVLDMDDLARAEQSYSGPIEVRLEMFRRDMASAFPTNIEELYFLGFHRLEKILGRDLVHGFLAMLTLGRNGWRERDFRVLLPQFQELLASDDMSGNRSAVTNAFLNRCFSRFDSKYEPPEPGDQASPMALAVMRLSFRTDIVARGDLRWDFSHCRARDAALAYLDLGSRKMKRLHGTLAVYLIKQRIDDPIRCDELTWHLMQAEEFFWVMDSLGYSMAKDRREREATRGALIEKIRQDGVGWIIGLLNSNVTIRAVDGEGNVHESSDVLEEGNRLIARDVMVGFCRGLVDDILPVLPGSVTLEQRHTVLTMICSRLFEVLETEPDNREVQILFSEALGRFSQTSRLLGNFEEAAAAAKRAAAIRESTSSENARDDAVERASLLMIQGDMEMEKGNRTEAERYYNAAMEILDEQH